MDCRCPICFWCPFRVCGLIFFLCWQSPSRLSHPVSDFLLHQLGLHLIAEVDARFLLLESWHTSSSTQRSWLNTVWLCCTVGSGKLYSSF
jgi:hypothetical protein